MKTLAAFGRIKSKKIEIDYASDDAYYNWLSRISDDNPDYKSNV